MGLSYSREPVGGGAGGTEQKRQKVSYVHQFSERVLETACERVLETVYMYYIF